MVLPVLLLPRHYSSLASSISVATRLSLALLLAVGLAPTLASAQDPNVPEEHFKVERPANLSNGRALEIYLGIAGEMAAGYRLSDHPASAGYEKWRRYNAAPYRSATHGERFVNNYGNMRAKSYGLYEDLQELPVGSILAKDSFAVTDSGSVFVGPLFLMEKMPQGFNPASRDWRYAMIMPDGSFFGETNGVGSQRMEFCITCHQAAGDENDHLFFIPETLRVTFDD